MNTVNLYFLLISILCPIFVSSCEQNTKLEKFSDSLEVEIKLAKSMSVNNQDLKLIGFKTFYASDENEKIKIKELAPIMKKKMNRIFMLQRMEVSLEYISLYIRRLLNVMVRYIMLMRKALLKLMMLLIWMRLM